MKDKISKNNWFQSLVDWMYKRLGLYIPNRTIEVGKNDQENQIQEYHCYSDGEHTHTVRMHYFTREQFEKIEKIKEKIYREHTKT